MALSQVLVQAPTDALMSAMTGSKNQNARRLAAAYLGSKTQQGDKSIARQVVAAYRFDVEAIRVPWHGGPLFVPALAWDKRQARELVAELVRWHLCCDRHGKKPQQRQIHNNLRGLALARIAGYRSPGWQEIGTGKWLEIWGKVVGLAGIEAILEQQGVMKDPRYRQVFTRLP